MLLIIRAPPKLDASVLFFRLVLWKESVDCLDFLVPRVLDFPDFVEQVPES